MIDYRIAACWPQHLTLTEAAAVYARFSPDYLRGAAQVLDLDVVRVTKERKA